MIVVRMSENQLAAQTAEISGENIAVAASFRDNVRAVPNMPSFDAVHRFADAHTVAAVRVCAYITTVLHSCQADETPPALHAGGVRLFLLRKSILYRRGDFPTYYADIVDIVWVISNFARITIYCSPNCRKCSICI